MLDGNVVHPPARAGFSVGHVEEATDLVEREAECCALPIALSLLGISAASLVGIGYLAAQYQRELFYAAVICLGAAGVVMWRQRRARLGVSGATCARPTLDWGSKIALLLASGLLALTFWIEPPI